MAAKVFISPMHSETGNFGAHAMPCAAQTPRLPPATLAPARQSADNASQHSPLRRLAGMGSPGPAFINNDRSSMTGSRCAALHSPRRGSSWLDLIPF